MASVKVKFVMTVSLDGITYTDAKATGSLVSESTTEALISAIRSVRTLSLMMNTCARAPRHRKRHRRNVGRTFFIVAECAAKNKP